MLKKGKASLGDFENVAFLKEREGDILGDGKFSGIPNFRNSKFLEM